MSICSHAPALLLCRVEQGGPCGRPDCSVCSICTHGFKLQGFLGRTAQRTRMHLRYGQGLYFSSVSGKANDYAFASEKVHTRQCLIKWPAVLVPSSLPACLSASWLFMEQILYIEAVAFGVFHRVQNARLRGQRGQEVSSMKSRLNPDKIFHVKFGTKTSWVQSLDCIAYYVVTSWW